MVNLNQLQEAIMSGNLPLSVDLTKQAIAGEIDPGVIINDHMAKAMEEVGARFEAGQAFVPQLLIAARAMKGALEILKPLLAGKEGGSQAGTVVIGTVKGDLHDIGKNLVASMLEGCGFNVINLGIDISSDQFVEAAKEHKADIVCLSALLTTTMVYMKEVIGALETEGIREGIKIMIGGAPVSQKFADEIGADGYSSNANAAVSLAKSLLAS